jgi:cytochrome c oxidase subunit 3
MSRHILFLSSQSSTFFYLLTAAHAFHLLVGILALVTTLIILQRSHKLGTRQVWVDSTVWYWHAMGALWLVLYAVLEFGQ